MPDNILPDIPHLLYFLPPKQNKYYTAVFVTKIFVKFMKTKIDMNINEY